MNGYDPQGNVYPDTGQPLFRYLDITPANLVEFDWPRHPAGRYVSVADLHAGLEAFPDITIRAALACIIASADAAIPQPEEKTDASEA